MAKGEYRIRNCGGCQRVSNEGKQYAFSVSGKYQVDARTDKL